jgi:Zn-finger domain-containing protein
MQQYSIKKHKKELKRKRKRKIVRLERLRESISKRRIERVSPR